MIPSITILSIMIFNVDRYYLRVVLLNAVYAEHYNKVDNAECRYD
jgi:hypothetical protein